MGRKYNTTCSECGGLIMEPMKTYGYCGPVCYCDINQRRTMTASPALTTGITTTLEMMKKFAPSQSRPMYDDPV